jgi:hypothetical protein
MSLTTTNPIINIPQIDMFSQQWSIKNEEKKIEWNLSKLKLIYTSFCIQNRQVLGISRLYNKYSIHRDFIYSLAYTGFWFIQCLV